jgi:Xaa-Pro aminopeptidase
MPTKKKTARRTRRPAPPSRLLFSASETDADMLYPTGFFAPDPFLFIQKGKRKILVMSDLEMDRARQQATVDRVMSWSKIAAPLETKRRKPTNAEVIAAALAQLGLKRVDVPESFPLGLAMELDALGVRLDLVPDPFWPEREIKRPDEVKKIEASLRAAEAGLEAGIEALKACSIGRDGWLKKSGRRFTAEELRSAINTRVMQAGCVPAHTICAPGDQAVDPHNEGHGPIRAHQPVIMDIFPRSEKTGYFGDLTRTVVRGKASFALHEMYAIVHEGVRLGHRRAKEGVQGLDIHQEIQALFARQGYKTGVQKGRMQGFFHGTGHGVGLQIHEAPSVGKRPYVLQAGHVVTIEPGLYYMGLGGVRIEDMALIRKRDSRCLTRVPKQLEI